MLIIIPSEIATYTPSKITEWFSWWISMQNPKLISDEKNSVSQDEM